MTGAGFLKQLFGVWLTPRRRRRNFAGWEEKWATPDFAAPWLRRGISPEILASVSDGWLPAGGSSLDIGCGEGEVTAWMARAGFRSVGIDIAPAAIARARSKSPEIRGRLEFHCTDLCAQPPPDRQYRSLIDRGCFHQIAPEDRRDFLKHLLSACAPDARLVLFVRAYREGQPMGEPKECQRVTGVVEAGFSGGFRIVRSSDTYLDRHGGTKPDQALGGRVFWLQRR